LWLKGFFDCMKVHQAGYPFVVALMGCSISEEQERLLVSAADMVLLMVDGDEAGRKGAALARKAGVLAGGLQISDFQAQIRASSRGGLTHARPHIHHGRRL
jgi:DNA primase